MNEAWERASAVVLEVKDRQVGVLVPARQGFVFRSATPEADKIDGQPFRSIRCAERTLHILLSNSETR